MRPFLVLCAAAVALAFAPTADAAKKKPAKTSAKKKGGGAPNVKLKPLEDPIDEGTTPSEGTSAAAPPSRGPTRIDFDDRLIQGQTNKSGAVYLYDRKELKTRSMVKKRESFREEIIGSIYDD